MSTETNHYLADGGVISNYPLFVLPKDEHIRTLSILIRTSIKKHRKFNGGKYRGFNNVTNSNCILLKEQI